MNSSQLTIAETLAEFVAGLDYASIPAAIRAQAKLHLLDSVGVALASSGFDFARKAFAGLAALGTGDYPVIGMPGKLAMRDAVLMNGMLVHGIEFDDTAARGRIHPSAFCVPCALGTGTFVKASGKNMLAAYIAGVECSVRIGMAARGGFSPAGFNAVGVVGAFGSALIAGKLLGLDPAQLTMSQGIAYSTAAGNREFSAADSWTKRFEAGWPAASGITAAMLAKHGYIGPRTALEGKYGVFNTYLNAPAAAADVAAITSGLGEDWEFSRILIKMLPSCFFNHAIINSTIAVVTQHEIAASNIRSIRALVPKAAIDTVCEPRDKKSAPHDIASAQFSIYYSAAAAAIRRRFTLDELDAKSLNDPAIRALAQKVEYGVDSKSNFPAHYSGGVEITTVDGRTFSAREDVNQGSTEKPLTASAIEEKFMSNVGRVLSRERATEIRSLLLDIERCDDISALAARLALG
jgi:2-methylcitrate dehydratase PrpD